MEGMRNAFSLEQKHPDSSGRIGARNSVLPRASLVAIEQQKTMCLEMSYTALTVSYSSCKDSDNLATSIHMQGIFSNEHVIFAVPFFLV